MADNITNILSGIQKKLKAPKSQTNAFGKYKYRSCEDIVEAVKPLLGDNALLLTDELVNIGDRYYIKATAILSNGSPNTAEANGYAREALERKGMDVSQITGTASSYARKYALNGLFAIDDTKDADHECVSKEQIDPAPINRKVVEEAAKYFKEEIDKDNWESSAPIKTMFHSLTNDEKIALGDLLTDKAPDSNKMYKSLLKDYLKYTPEEGVQK